jgi:rhamnosyltransferase
VLFAINSASVINLKKLPGDVYYDERLVIDGTDIDFCLTLKQKGREIRIDTSQCITHGIGNRADGAGRWSPTNYSAQRKHLGAKNRFMVWRRYYKDFPGFVINDLYIFILDTCRTVLLEKERFKKLWAIITGVMSGLREKNIITRKHNDDLLILISNIKRCGTDNKI